MRTGPRTLDRLKTPRLVGKSKSAAQAGGRGVWGAEPVGVVGLGRESPWMPGLAWTVLVLVYVLGERT